MKRFFKLKWILSGAAVLLAVVYLVIPDSAATGDELTKYEKMWTQLTWARRFERWEKRVPKPVGAALRLAALKYRARGKAGQCQKELLASGFFAEYDLVITNFPAGMTDPGRQFQEVHRRVLGLETNRVFWSFNMPSNQFRFTCRPQDLPLIQRAANQP